MELIYHERIQGRLILSRQSWPFKPEPRFHRLEGVIREEPRRVASGTVHLCLAASSKVYPGLQYKPLGVAKLSRREDIVEHLRAMGSILLAVSTIPCVSDMIPLYRPSCLPSTNAFLNTKLPIECAKKMMGCRPMGVHLSPTPSEKSSIRIRRSLAKSMILRLVPAPLKLKLSAKSSKISFALAWGNASQTGI